VLVEEGLMVRLVAGERSSPGWSPALHRKFRWTRAESCARGDWAWS